MIRASVKEMAERRGITKPFTLKRLTGLPLQTAYRLWSGDFARVDLTTLDTLCQVLKCKPNDLLVFEKIKD